MPQPGCEAASPGGAGPGEPWWITFFRGDLYTEGDTDFGDKTLTEAMVDCAASLLDQGPGTRLLDLACGPGRHSLPLSRRGFLVTGVDTAEAYLEAARRQADTGKARFLRADMRDLSALADGSFDAVASLHTSFGFFPARAENLRVLREARRVLVPGGRLLLDVLNRDWFLRQAPEPAPPGDYVVRSYDERPSAVYLHEERFDPVTSRITWTITETAGRRSATASYRTYSAHELAELAGEAGFRVTALFGDYDRSPFHLTAPHVICLADAA